MQILHTPIAVEAPPEGPGWIDRTAPVPHSRRHIFLTVAEWKNGLLIAAVAGATVLPWSIDISPWLGVSVALFVLTVYHMRHAANFIVTLPHIAIMISALEYVLAAWGGVYFPPANPVYDIGPALPFYLSYAGPVLLAVCAGWSISLVRLKVKARPLSTPASPGLLMELDLIMFIGIVATVAAPLLADTGFEFVGVLLGYIRFVGVHGRMLLRGPGWQWRLGLALGVELFFAAESAMFNPLLLWCLWTFSIWLYCFRPTFRLILASLVVGAILLPSLQEAKWRLRDGLPDMDLVASGDDSSSPGRTVAWLGYLSEALVRTVTLRLPRDFLEDTLVRYNQGWIINRTMLFVPEIEPYAEGETLVSAARSALLPRVIDNEKVRAGGQVLMERYAGMTLNEQTAMTLGYAGEMYANFGRLWGAVACGLYALGFGLLLRPIFKRATLRPVWWAIVPYIFFAVLKGDDDVAFVLNWTVKACVLLAGVIVFLPNFRRALFGSLDQADIGGGMKANFIGARKAGTTTAALR